MVILRHPTKIDIGVWDRYRIRTFYMLRNIRETDTNKPREQKDSEEEK
jgi:hypothetical protein